MKRLAALFVGLAIAVLAAVAAWLAFSPHGAGQPPAEVGDVLFVTTRAENDDKAPAERFDGRRGSVSRGRCSVGYRPLPLAERIAGEVEFWVPTDLQEVRDVALLDRPAFEAAIGERARGPIVLFVHGYSYGFDRTCRMGADLQRMLGEEATVVMFSWPSDANPVDYVADQVDMEWSVPELADLLAELAGRDDGRKLKLLAHSLGTRGVLFALDLLALRGDDGPAAEHLVLLAPDYDRQAFIDQWPRFRHRADRVTLYASSNDTPLKVSAALHDHPRLGQAGEHLVVLDGMTTIDVSALGRVRPSGHEYFFYDPAVAADLAESLLHGTPAEKRSNIRSRTLDGRPYWALLPPESATK